MNERLLLHSPLLTHSPHMLFLSSHRICASDCSTCFSLSAQLSSSENTRPQVSLYRAHASIMLVFGTLRGLVLCDNCGSADLKLFKAGHLRFTITAPKNCSLLRRTSKLVCVYPPGHGAHHSAHGLMTHVIISQTYARENTSMHQVIEGGGSLCRTPFLSLYHRTAGMHRELVTRLAILRAQTSNFSTPNLNAETPDAALSPLSAKTMGTHWGCGSPVADRRTATHLPSVAA